MLEDLIGKLVAVDTNSSVLVIGRLLRVNADVLMLEDADLYDSSEAHSSKELYAINAKKLGVRVSRKRIYVLKDRIVAITRLDDFVE